MTATSADVPATVVAAAPAPPRGPVKPRGARLLRWLDILGLTWFTPLVSISCGEPPRSLTKS